MQRATSLRLPLSELAGASYNGSEEKNGCIRSRSGFPVSRVNVWGNVVRVFVSESNDFRSITLDDFTACIDVNVFKENLPLFDSIAVGDVVAVTGMVRKGKRDAYILADSARKISGNEELIKRLENIKSVRMLGRQYAEKKADEQKWAEEELEIEKNEL